MPDTVSGKQLESFVESYLNSLGFETLTYKTYSENKNKDNVLVSNVPYVSIYGSNCRTEFLLCLKKRKIRIECKWQGTSGSTGCP